MKKIKKDSQHRGTIIAAIITSIAAIIAAVITVTGNKENSDAALNDNFYIIFNKQIVTTSEYYFVVVLVLLIVFFFFLYKRFKTIDKTNELCEKTIQEAEGKENIQSAGSQNIMISGDVSGVVNLNVEDEKNFSKKFFKFKVFGIPILVIEIFIGVYLITIFNNNIITKMDGVSTGGKQGVAIGGNVVVSGDSAITGHGDIHINKTASNSSDRIVSIQKRLRNLQSKDPVISYLIQKAKEAFYANNLDEAEKILKEIDIKQRGNP